VVGLDVPSRLALNTVTNDVNIDGEWQCKSCLENEGAAKATIEVSEEPVTELRRASTPKMVRELLPVELGRDSHTVFGNPILEEEVLDGSRTLRKRKASVAPENYSEVTTKRNRRSMSRLTEQRARSSSRLADNINVTPHVKASKPSDLEPETPIKAGRGRPRRQLEQLIEGPVRIVASSNNPKSLIIAIPVTAAAMDRVDRIARKKQRRRDRDRARRALNNPQPRRRHTSTRDEFQYPIIATNMYANPYYPFADRENEEQKGKPFGGILTEAEADTQKTYPQQNDKDMFENAKLQAEEEWQKKAELMEESKPKTVGLPSKIKCINFGHHEIDTWHAAPYPEEYSRNKVLYICEFCLKYMSSDFVGWRHKVSLDMHRSKVMYIRWANFL